MGLDFRPGGKIEETPDWRTRNYQQEIVDMKNLMDSAIHDYAYMKVEYDKVFKAKFFTRLKYLFTKTF